jgi:hypothetical protein
MLLQSTYLGRSRINRMTEIKLFSIDLFKRFTGLGKIIIGKLEIGNNEQMLITIPTCIGPYESGTNYQRFCYPLSPVN